MPEILKLDIKDQKIIRELDMNARIPLNQLAKRVGLSRQALQYRIGRMQKTGIILGAFTIFDSAILGQRWFRVILQLGEITTVQKQKFITYFKTHPNIMWLGEVGGNWDFVLNFVTRDQFTFDKLFEQILEVWGSLIQRYEVLVYINVRDQARNYVLPEYETKTTELFHEMKYASNLKLDDLDKKLIQIISKNAGLSSSELGLKVMVSYKTIQARMHSLEKSGLILGYRLLIHPAKLGYESHMLFLGLHTFDSKTEKRLYEFLKHPNVTFLVKQLGRWRIGIEVEFKNRQEFQNFLVELRTHFGSIIYEYETFPIFRDHAINYFPEGALD